MSSLKNAPSDLQRLTEFEALASSPEALEAIPGAVYVCDSEGRLVCFNSEAAAAWGRKPKLATLEERFCGSLRLFLPDGRPLPHSACPMADALRHGTPVRNQEVVVERPDGSRIVALVNIHALKDRDGRIQGAINCFQDISERKEIEAEVCPSRRVRSHSPGVCATKRDRSCSM
jgi:PAS domain-containing protein